MNNVNQVTQVIFGLLKEGLVAELRADGQGHIAEWLDGHSTGTAVQELAQELTTCLTTMRSSSRHPTGNTQERQAFNNSLATFKERIPWFEKIGDLREYEERITANIARPGNTYEATSRVMSTFASMLRLFNVYKGDDRLYDDLHRAVFDTLARSHGR